MPSSWNGVVKSHGNCNRCMRNGCFSSAATHAATYFNTLQHAAIGVLRGGRYQQCCNTQQHTATRCITLQHTSTHCNTLQLLCVRRTLSAVLQHTLQHTEPHTAISLCSTDAISSATTHCNRLPTHCNNTLAGTCSNCKADAWIYVYAYA